MNKEDGFSILEILVTFSMVGILTGIAVSNLRTLENPVFTGANQVMGFVKQARAKAIATTSAYTIYPSSSTTISARYGKTCADVDTIEDPKLSLELPDGAAFTDTTWSLCFASRGLPTENRQIYVSSLSDSTQTLGVEVYLGGAVRVQ